MGQSRQQRRNTIGPTPLNVSLLRCEQRPNGVADFRVFLQPNRQQPEHRLILAAGIGMNVMRRRQPAPQPVKNIQPRRRVAQNDRQRFDHRRLSRARMLPKP